MATALMLIDQGGSLKEKETSGATPLHTACFNGHTATALMLIEHGASLTEKDINGATPLHVACQKGHNDLAVMLIEHGASLTERVTMATLLFIWLVIKVIMT